MNPFGIRTPADLRAVFHLLAPVLAGSAVASGWVDDSKVNLILTLALVISQATLATFKSATVFRKWLYALVGAAAAVLIAFGWLDSGQWAIWGPLVLVIVNGGVAVANVNTSKDYELAA